MPKYKVGDTVSCLPVQPERPLSQRGAGFKAGYTFKVKEITLEKEADPIYWPFPNGNGIYEHELEEMDWDG
jgi:hypothetical protein